MVKGVIFDFDGLIVDTESIWFEAYRESVKQLYQAEIELDGYATCIGTSSEGLYHYFKQIVPSDVDCQAIERLASDKYQSRLDALTLREGVLDYLNEARELKLKIGLASSSSKAWVESYLEHFNILKYFEVINTKDHVQRVKPSPELYLKTLAELNLDPVEAIAFEDSLNGLKAAKEAGLYCVVVPNPVTAHLPFEQHDFTLLSMGERSLSEIIEKIQG